MKAASLTGHMFLGCFPLGETAIFLRIEKIMILGIGTDVCEIARIEKACERKGFLERYFTAGENRLFEERNLRPQTIAANFAVKEAVAKALGTGFCGFTLKDIETLRDDLGKPVVTLLGQARERFLAMGGQKIHVSISHSGKDAVAFVILEGESA